VTRRLLKAVVVLLGLVVLVSLGGYLYLRQSLPIVDGAITVNGLDQSIDIVRDADGIPHILANSKRDALFGLGYVHAQDRLWQMEFQRRIGHGRLSEIFGAAALPQDRFLRTVGFGRAARRSWARLSVEARADTNAYVAGINAFVESHRGRKLPPEFSLLQFEPEPWSGEDVMAWVKMMAWDLGANYSQELLRRDLIAKVGPERAAQLTPGYPADGLTIVGATKADTPSPPADPESSSSTSQTKPATPNAPATRSTVGTRLDPDPDGAPGGVTAWAPAVAEALSNGNPAVTAFLLNSATTEAIGSNSWVVDGTRTASGKPLLANDPHLGANIPSIWYLAHMSAGAFDVIGATLPGTPAVAIGRNRHIAWGETNVAADVQDLYLEKLDEAGRAAEFQGQMEPLFVVREEIKIKGADPLTIDVRISRHGPLVSDAINATTAASSATGGPASDPLPPLAFRWIALDDDDTTLDAFLRLNEARNWTEFLAAMRLFVTPSQNFVYADVDGHIGYLVPGRIPVRQSGDGSRPMPGWTGEHEWTGWIPFDALPRVFDPPGHVIVTANHRPNPLDDPHHLGLEYPEPYRAERIAALIGDRRGLTVDDFRRMQADTYSRHAAGLLPLLLRLVEPMSSSDAMAVDLLRNWRYDATADAAAPAIFEAWFLRLAPTIVGDDVGARLLGSYQGRYSYVTRFLVATLTRDDATWCDDVTTASTETCRHAVSKALHDAILSLEGRLGEDPRSWKWGDVHAAVFPHQGLDAVAAFRPILNRRVPNGGDWSTVNVGPVVSGRPYEQTEVPGYRQIIDLSPSNDSRFLDAVGPSGHFLSPLYDSYLDRFRTVDHLPMRVDRARIDEGATGTLRLRPALRE